MKNTRKANPAGCKNDRVAGWEMKAERNFEFSFSYDRISKKLLEGIR